MFVYCNALGAQKWWSGMKGRLRYDDNISSKNVLVKLDLLEGRLAGSVGVST